jgi:hypothetical protein
MLPESSQTRGRRKVPQEAPRVNKAGEQGGIFPSVPPPPAGWAAGARDGPVPCGAVGPFRPTVQPFRGGVEPFRGPGLPRTRAVGPSFGTVGSDLGRVGPFRGMVEPFRGTGLPPSKAEGPFLGRAGPFRSAGGPFYGILQLSRGIFQLPCGRARSFRGMPRLPRGRDQPFRGTGQPPARTEGSFPSWPLQILFWGGGLARRD